MTLSDMHLTDGEEDPKTRAPVISLLLANAALVPIVAGTAAAVGLGTRRRPMIAGLTVAWSGAVLCFLAGVRRGLSFRQPGGSTVAQVGATLWLFVLGAAALVLPRRGVALVLLLLGYGSMAVLDPSAARRGEAPRYFARLRPVQMLVPILSLLVLLAKGGSGRAD